MEKISVVVCTFQEENNIVPFLKSVKGIKDVVVADDGSTDKTVELAKSMGARVFRRHDHSETATQKDTDDFKKRFNWLPQFKAGDKIKNGSANRMEAISYAKNDWVLFPDADERITWDLPEIIKLLPNADQITCDFVHSHKPDGSPEQVSTITKMFRKSVSRIEARVHDVLIPYGRIIYTDKMRIDHYQKVRSRTEILPILEYSVLKDDDSRSKFYLGREYFYFQKYDKAITLLNLYLKVATWQPEIQQAHIYLAKCYWESQRGDLARSECLEAIRRNPDSKEALNMMSEYYFEPEKSKWKFIADNATNKDILF